VYEKRNPVGENKIETQKRICAWCNRMLENGRKPVTHGICHECAAKEISNYRIGNRINPSIRECTSKEEGRRADEIFGNALKGYRKQLKVCDQLKEVTKRGRKEIDNLNSQVRIGDLRTNFPRRLLHPRTIKVSLASPSYVKKKE
jgi:hypothetical protein